VGAGFTTVRNVGAPATPMLLFEMRLMLAMSRAPHDGSGPPLGITGGHCDNNLLPFEYHYKAEGVADGPWAARAKVRETIKYGADLIKVCASRRAKQRGPARHTAVYARGIATIAEERTSLDAKSPRTPTARNLLRTPFAPASIPSSTAADRRRGIALQAGIFLSFSIDICEHGASSCNTRVMIERQDSAGLQRDAFVVDQLLCSMESMPARWRP